MFKLALIGLIIIGKDPFALCGMQAPGIWVLGQENKVKLLCLKFDITLGVSVTASQFNGN
jgi:hypothetical protein